MSNYPVFGPESPGAWLERGDILGSQGRYYEALEAYNHGLSLYKRSLGSEPAFADIYNSIGLTYINLRQYQKALDNLQRALDLGCTNIYVRERRIMAYLKLADYRSAITECDFIINRSKRFSPSHKAGNFTPYFYRGEAYAELREFKQAITDYDNAIACAPLGMNINPSEQNAYYRRGEAYFALGKYRQALRDYDDALTKRTGKDVDQNDLRHKRDEALRQLR